MEKYAKLMKGLEMCAGPECCKDGCPYYNTTTGGMTCRARLLLDANIAITNEQGRAVEAEAELQDTKEALDTAKAEYEALAESARSVAAHRDAIESDREDITRERDKLRKELGKLHEDVDDLETMTNTLRAERDGMRIELERLTGEYKRLRTLCQGKNDRPSVSDDALKSEYKRGYLDAMEYCFRELCARVGGGGRHE